MNPQSAALAALPLHFEYEPMPTAIEADRLLVDSTSLAKHSDGACVMALSLARAGLTSRLVLLGEATIAAQMKAPV